LLQRAVELGNTDHAVLAELALAHAGGVVAPARVEPVKKAPVVKAKATKKRPRVIARGRRWR
jgi:hypothetical protein